ncbi:PhoH-like protein [Natranaerofaba carboxydovora]|nr:PhoH family protein [Natranaerofaba carboxydovora]UMZ73084.1 PhoH-like protein [Natranaerofaba carboxydovora]
MSSSFQSNNTSKFRLESNEIAQQILGDLDGNLDVIENLFSVQLIPKGQEIVVKGETEEVEQAIFLLEQLSSQVKKGKRISSFDIKYAAKMVKEGKESQMENLFDEIIYTTARGKSIKPKTVGQKEYVQAIDKNDIVFCIGPAGTGKTFLAMAMAMAHLKDQKVNRIILTRPAVEAGENLGFLPGSFQEKVDPYLRPLYDALFDLLGVEKVEKYMEKGIIEIAPLAYMRGRTLDDSFVILDEAQNTTSEQMKMFLTRLGFDSKAVVTGDVTQVDLPSGKHSGLIEVTKILKDVKGLSFVYLSDSDVVRHELVQRIILAYEKYNSG